MINICENRRIYVPWKKPTISYNMYSPALATPSIPKPSTHTSLHCTVTKSDSPCDLNSSLQRGWGSNYASLAKIYISLNVVKAFMRAVCYRVLCYVASVVTMVTTIEGHTMLLRRESLLCVIIVHSIVM